MEGATMGRIVAALFPEHPQRPPVDFGRVEDVPLFTFEELETSVLSLKSNKAPGPDGIPSEALKKAFLINADLLMRMYNACLVEGVFPAPWKTARLVLISKGKGDPELPSSHRPLCMLDTAGKLFEKLIRSRLTSAVEAAGDLCPRQYGFRKGRSTIDAVTEVQRAVERAESHNHFSRRVVLLVTLDVKNAFNSARWVDMLDALRNTFRIPAYLLRLIEDYLRSRSLIYDTRDGTRTMEVTSGAAQGSILGPDLWNVAYDSLLRSEMPEETTLVGYADDVAALIAARNVELAQLKLNRVMRVVNTWMSDHGLSLALSKTEIVILTKKRIDTVVPLRVGREVVTSTRAAKYLGVMVDTKLSWRDQIFRTADKAAKVVTYLSRLMANVGGPRSSRRRLLMSAVQSVLLYGAEVWAGALDKECYRLRLARVQRQAALRVCSAYRTVSEPAVLVVAGVIPVKLLAGERKAIYQRQGEIGKDTARTEERSRTFQQWQHSWEHDTRGRWTARLIKFHKLVWGSCGGGVIVGGCDNGRLQMYNSARVLAGDDGLLCAPERHTGHVKAVDFNSFQTNLLSSGASDSEIFIWDLNNVKTPMTPGAKSQPAEEVMSLAWNKQVQHILASAFATRCVVWDLRKNEPIIKLSDSNSRVRWKEVAWHPDIATQLCLASEEDSNPVIQLWDLRFATTPIKTFEGHQKGVLSIAWCAQDPELLVSCGKDSRILCWNPAAAQQGDEIVCELVTSNQWNFEVTWCPRNPSLIATSSFDGHASVFTLVGGQQQMQTTNKIADSFPGMDHFAEAPVVQPPQHSHVAVELRKAPKWLKRPVGASFGFGGKLVTFGGGAEAGAVHVSQVVTEPSLLERSARLQQLLSCGQLREICHSKSDPVWSFVAASLEPDYRTAMRTLLGFTQEQLELNKYIGQPVNAKLGDIDGLAEDFSVLSQDGSDDEVRLMNNSSSGLDSFNIVQNNANQFNSFNKSEENSFEKKSPFKIKIGEDPEGVICRALLAGNLELAVELCVREGRMTDAIILAHTAGPDVLAATQYKYFQQNQNYLSHLLSAVVTNDWSQVVSSCDLGSWAEALAAILTYASDDQLPLLAERLGDRLEREGGADSHRNSEICFVAAGQLGHLIHNRISSDLSTEALQELVEMVLVAKRGSVQDSGTAHLVDRYAQLLAAQGDFATALAYLSSSQEEEIEELRERLYVASGQKPYPTPTVQRTQQNAYYQNSAPAGYANNYAKPINQAVKQPAPFNQQLASAFPPANQQTRSPSVPSITPPRKPSISNPLMQNSVPSNTFPPSSSSFPATSSSMFPQTQTAFGSQPQAPPPTGPPANFSTTSAFAPPSTQKPFQPPPPAQPPIGSRTPVHFNSESLPPPPANAVPPSTFSHRSSPSPSLAGSTRSKYVVDPSVAGGGVGYGRTSTGFNSNSYMPQPSYNAPPQPYNPSPAQPFNPPPTQPFNPPPSQPFNPPSSQPFNPLSQPYNPLSAQPFNTQNAQTFNPPGAPPPMVNQPEPKLPQQFVPQASAAPGWNDPPTLTASKRSQPKEVHQPPPITHPLFATAPAPSQELPSQGPPMQGMQGMQQHQATDNYSLQQQGYNYPPVAAPAMAAPPPAPVAKVAEPPRPKPPLPEEHMYLQTVFDELRNRCTCAANNPQLKRKLEDVARKLEVLYDALRENKMSNTTVGSLHQLVQMVQNGDYTGALHLHTQLVSGPDFSQISAFMPGLKVLIQSALQLGVYLQ